MALITNPQAVRFSNERLRVLADTLTTAYYTAKKVMQEYYADPNLGDVYTAGMADVVADGSVQDGRPTVTGSDALLLIARASELISDLEASNNAKLNTLLAVQVNGQSRV